jgi:hypothetical protein
MPPMNVAHTHQEVKARSGYFVDEVLDGPQERPRWAASSRSVPRARLTPS